MAALDRQVKCVIMQWCCHGLDAVATKVHRQSPGPQVLLGRFQRQGLAGGPQVTGGVLSEGMTGPTWILSLSFLVGK